MLHYTVEKITHRRERVRVGGGGISARQMHEHCKFFTA